MQFKSTHTILKRPDINDVFDPNWMDSNTVVTPATAPWDYKKELNIEDVEIWEVIIEYGGGLGVYAAWKPYAEFYLVTTGVDYSTGKIIDNYHYQDKFFETYYGPGAQKKVQEKMKELGLFVFTHPIWVENEEMWLYQDEDSLSKKLYL
jgi:hypothetical protein